MAHDYEAEASELALSAYRDMAGSSSELVGMQVARIASALRAAEQRGHDEGEQRGIARAADEPGESGTLPVGGVALAKAIDRALDEVARVLWPNGLDSEDPGSGGRDRRAGDDRLYNCRAVRKLLRSARG